MMDSIDVFFEMPCLTESSTLLRGIAVQKKWFKAADRRIMGQYLQKFIDYNSACFSFLGVTPVIIGTDQNTAIAFRSSSFVGSIPLRSADTGRQIGDFVVNPRFSSHHRFEDYVEILHLLGNAIDPETIDSLPLVSGRNFRPPLYLEAAKFMVSLEKLVKTNWRKFSVVEKNTQQPVGQVNWDKYIQGKYKVENQLLFASRRNVLDEFHSEYRELRYVFDICKNELNSPNTPVKVRTTHRSMLAYLDERMRFHQPRQTGLIKVRVADSPVVKECKGQANKILTNKFINSTAWRVDFSNVFEKFIQYIFKAVARETGGKLYSNLKFPAQISRSYAWELAHLEPDAIYQKGNLMAFIDAKYKSNLYNKFDGNERLKETFRSDLHQLLAYSSFGQSSEKYGFLCYPSDKIEIKKTVYKNGINAMANTIFIVGVPLKSEIIGHIVPLIIKCFS